MPIRQHFRQIQVQATAEMTRLMAWPASGKKAVGLQESDLPVQQVDLPPEEWTPGYADFASACSGVM
jgi:hypothetical protein